MLLLQPVLDAAMESWSADTLTLSELTRPGAKISKVEGYLVYLIVDSFSRACTRKSVGPEFSDSEVGLEVGREQSPACSGFVGLNVGA